MSGDKKDQIQKIADQMSMTMYKKEFADLTPNQQMMIISEAAADYESGRIDRAMDSSAEKIVKDWEDGKL